MWCVIYESLKKKGPRGESNPRSPCSCKCTYKHGALTTAPLGQDLLIGIFQDLALFDFSTTHHFIYAIITEYRMTSPHRKDEHPSTNHGACLIAEAEAAAVQVEATARAAVLLALRARTTQPRLFSMDAEISEIQRRSLHNSGRLLQPRSPCAPRV